MDEATETGSLLKLWAWVETNKKQAAWGAGGAIVLALAIWFLLWRHGEQQVKAGEALSQVFVPQLMTGGPARPETVRELLKVAAQYPGSEAGAEATLMAAGDLFTEGKYDQARVEFEKFARLHRASALEASALLGIAACLDAQHKTEQAKTAYKSLIDQHPNDPVTLQAKFSLACIYGAQNMPELERNYLEEVARARSSILSSEAALRLQALFDQHPELAPTAPPPVTLTPTLTAATASNAPPAKAPAPAPAKAPAPAPAEAPLPAPRTTPANTVPKGPTNAAAQAPLPAPGPTAGGSGKK
jgi:tetratricopeptide (TPR) repeat protein